MENSLIIALHGFLGLPTDWTSWKNKINDSQAQFQAINLWTHPTLNSSLSFQQWTEAFISEVESYTRQGIQIELWGYSMGGRLTLSALTQAPSLFQRAVILSSNPGIENDEDRPIRLKQDLIWSHKFLMQDWDSLMKEWNQQPVFRETVTERQTLSKTQRHEHDFSRSALAQALDHWSLARQPNLCTLMKSLTLPIDWHVGSLDEKYLLIAQQAKAINPSIKVTIHENQGHRLLTPIGQDESF